VTTRGPATTVGFRQLTGLLIEEARRRPGLRILTDHRELDFSVLSGEALRGVAREVRSKTQTLDDLRVAIVLASVADYGLGRMVALTGDFAFDLRPFFSLQEARAWLATADR
jgi:hypothetical protein